MAWMGANKTMRSVDAVQRRSADQDRRASRQTGGFAAAGARGRSLLLASTVLSGVLTVFSPAAFAQQGGAKPADGANATAPGPLLLDSVTVEGEDSRGPGAGIVAKRSAAASKTDTSILETPQAVSVVTRGQMDAQGAGSVSEALRYTPGVNAESNGYDIRYDWLWVRGFNTYGTMWLDGLTLPGDPNNYATPSIDLHALERVEVVKGPASVLYGRAVPGGLVNQVSKRPLAKPYREVAVETSGFGGIEGSVDMTGPLTDDGKWLYRFTGLARNMGTQVDMERDRRIMVAPSITWKPQGGTSLTLHGYYQRDRDTFSARFYPARGTLLSNPAGQIPRDRFFADPNADEFNRDYYAIGYEFSHRFDETWTVRQNLRYGRADQDMFIAIVNPAFAFSGPPSSVLDRVSAISKDRLSTFAVDTQAEAAFRTGPLAHTVLFGVDYVRGVSDTKFGNSGFRDPVPPPIDFLNPTYGYVIPVPAYQRSGRQEQNQVGFYTQDQIRYGRWVGTLGMRYDMSSIETADRMTMRPNVSTDDNQFTGRVGLTYLFDNGVAPYASYSTSFLPVLGTDRGGSPFEAQTAEQFEVGVKYEPPGGRGLVTVSLFTLTMEGALTSDPVDTRFSVQSGEQRVRGVEIEGKYEVTTEIDLLGSYAYSDSEVVHSNRAIEVGRDMLRLPKHQASAWANYRPAYVPGLSLGAGVRATSSYQSDSTYLRELRIPGRAMVDAGISYDLGAVNSRLEGAVLRVNATNLFDREYVSHCLNLTGGSCNYGAGRTITAGLKYSW